MDTTQIELVARTAALLVGDRIRTATGGTDLEVSDKALNDLVTQIDVWSEQEIRRQIMEHFPDHQLIGEESSAELEQRLGKSLAEISRDGFCWVVDPLDGTANFVSGIPYSAVSIAVLYQGELIVGVVYDPHRNELFSAQIGRGATLNDRPIQVRSVDSVSQAVMISGYIAGHRATWTRTQETLSAYILNCRRVRMFGASALDQCWVACGRVDAFFEYGIKCWDIAAGALIASEAGATFGCIVEPKNPKSLFAQSHLVANPRLFALLQDLGHEADRHGQAELRSLEARKPRCG